MTSKCLEAAKILQKDKIEATALHIPTIKPIDVSKVIEVAKETGAVVTTENHSVIGGLGSVISELLVENMPSFIPRVGIRDTFGESAKDMEDLFMKYGLTSKEIIKTAKRVLEYKV